MLTLGIETSCDETSVALVEGRNVLANVVSSQIAHTKFGGVVPEIAARNHVRVLVPLTRLALEIASRKLEDVDLVAATRGPGLVGALLSGLSFAKSLCLGLEKPFIGVNHLEGHVYSLYIAAGFLKTPHLVLLVSGGHTELVLIEKKFRYRTVGRTRDDACGEAFDKVAKLIGMPYPGGPYIERAARQGRSGAVRFPVPRLKDFDFSYAGLKTAVMYYLRDNPDFDAGDVARNFQEAALAQLVNVTRRAAGHFRVKHIGLVGGVAASQALRDKLAGLAAELNVRLHIPPMQYSTDNAAMIALAGQERFLKFGPSDLDCDATSRESLEKISPQF